MENFREATAESFALKLMLGLLFSASPDALTRLQALEPEPLREVLGKRKGNTKEFIDQVIETIRSVQGSAQDWGPMPTR